jgi:hypothetical protein
LYLCLQLDAKKSPLALLAQTCSSIGKDTTPSKSLIPPLDKKDAQGSSGSSSSSGRKSESPKHHKASPDGRKSQSSTGGDRRESTSDSSESKSRPTPKDIPALVPIQAVSKSPHNDSSDMSAKSLPSSSVDRPNKEGTPVRCSSSHSTSASASVSAGTQSSTNSRISLSCGNMLLEVNHNDSYSTGLPKSGQAIPASHPSIPPSYKHDPLSLSSIPHSFAAYPGCSSLSLFGHPGAMASLDPASASSLYSASLAGHGLHAGLSQKSSLSPYVGYARIKTASGATTLVPFCRDPYCTNCQITLQNAQLGGSSSACGAGCTQCTHDKCFSIPTSLGSTSMGAPVLPITPGLASLAGVASAASSLPLPSSLYSHAFGVMPGHHGLPYTCNWMQGSEHCGKRFTTSEELLQHLRTHTTAGDVSSLAASGLSPYSSLGLPGCTSFHSTPGSVSPNSLRQVYPRSVSPASLLAASRFHPYKSPLATLPSPVSAGLPGTIPQPPGLGSYYSPYALYAQRLGAAAVAP